MQTNQQQTNRRLEQAKLFIELLTGAKDTPCTFQTFFENKNGAKPKTYARVFNGAIDKLWKVLDMANANGHGVFITVNETDLRGRTQDNVTRPRALFIDIDENKPLPASYPIEPSVVIESKNGWHIYWLLEDGERLEDFQAGQTQLIKYYNSDASIKDLPRVMRLPGFYHCKTAEHFPIKIKTYQKNIKVHTIQDIIDSHYVAPPTQDKSPLKDRDYRLDSVLLEIRGAAVTTKQSQRHDMIKRYTHKLTRFCDANIISEQERLDIMLEAAAEMNKGADHPVTKDEIVKLINWIDKLVEKNNVIGVKTFKPLKKLKPQKEKYQAPDCKLIARTIMDKYEFLRDIFDSVYQYNGNIWKVITINYLKSFVNSFDKNDMSMKRRSEVVEHILTARQVYAVKWNNLSNTEIAIEDGILDILTGKIRPHDKKYYLDKMVDITYHKDAQAPLWQTCLNDWFGNDTDGDDKIKALQEFLGYVILNHARYKKALMLIGQTNTGKSVVCHVIEGILGSRNICSIIPEDMGDPRKLAPIKGKYLNLVTELKSNASIHDAGFKRLVSTQEPIQIDQKYKAEEMYTPTCVHMLASNSIPSIRDRTLATYGRILLIQMNNIIPYHKQDKFIVAKLMDEKQGILNWMIEGAIRLTNAQGIFTEIKESRQILEQHRIEQNPIEQFINENFKHVPNSGARILYKAVYEMFIDWNNNKHISRNSFGRALTAINIKRNKFFINGSEKYYIADLMTLEQYEQWTADQREKTRLFDIELDQVLQPVVDKTIN